MHEALGSTRSPTDTNQGGHLQSHHSRGRGWETEVQAHSLPHSKSEVLLRSISPEPVSKKNGIKDGIKEPVI